MVTDAKKEYTLIETQAALLDFHQAVRSVPWMCFDTEFVGEKRFVTRLCLIQASTPVGNYLIDPFKLDDLDPFLTLVRDPAIKKITHAGDNDYRLLYELYQVTPKNVFDTQIAAGFAGYKYPVSLRKLVDTELKWPLKKAYTVTNWEARPFDAKQLRYALLDILPLQPLWQALEKKLRRMERLDWAEEEFLHLEQADLYIKDPNKEALDSRLIRSLNNREQIFLIRLYEWRRQMAEDKNYSKEMILPGKLLPQIVRAIQSGKEALLDNRRIPDKIAERHGATFERLYQQPPTQEEKRLLRQITTEEEEDPREEMLLELLYLAIKYRCLESDISLNLTMSKTLLKRLRAEPALAETLLEKGWRGRFLGEHFLGWLRDFDRLRLNVGPEGIQLQLP
jgi:ribonuclease D